MKKDSVRFPNKMLLGSIFFLLVGTGMLLVTTGVLPKYGDLWPIPMTLTGVLFLYFVSVRDPKFGYLVPGVILTMSGILLILHRVFFFDVPIDRFWPLFMTFAGCALTVYSLKFRRNTRQVILVPAVFITLLSLVFLPFSLGITKKSFRDVVVAWWPLLLIVLSAGMFMEFMHRKKD